MYVCIVCMYVCMCVCMYVYVCMYVCVSVCACVCMAMCTDVNACIPRTPLESDWLIARARTSIVRLLFGVSQIHFAIECLIVSLAVVIAGKKTRM
jgi:hypothetical protein